MSINENMNISLEEIRQLIFEVYAEVLAEAEDDELETPEGEDELPEPEEIEDVPDEEGLPDEEDIPEEVIDPTEEILEKFPTLRQELTNLLTDQFMDFVATLDWVAPKPTTFKVTLNNNQIFHMKWLGKGFQAEMAGKRFYLPKINEYQNALDKLNELLKYAAPQSMGMEGGEGADADFGAGGGGGDFPGEEGGGGADAEFEGGIETPVGGEEGEAEFEEPGSDPSAEL